MLVRPLWCPRATISLDRCLFPNSSHNSLRRPQIVKGRRILQVRLLTTNNRKQAPEGYSAKLEV